MRSLFKNLAVLGFAGLGLVHGAMPVSAGGQATRLKPGQGLTLDLGTKRAIAYFLPQNGGCSVTVMLSEAAVDGDAIIISPARVNMNVGAGTTAQIDTVGPSLAISCTTGAESIVVQTVSRTAYIATR